MYNISIDDDSVVVECRYLRHRRRRRHYLRRCFYARTCVRDQCARSFLCRIFIMIFPLMKLRLWSSTTRCSTRGIRCCNESRRVRLAQSISILSVIRFLNELPPLGGISRSPSCEASAIRSRARYVTIPARVYDYSTGNEVRRYTRGYPREKSIHDPPGPGFRRARIYFSNSRNHPLRKTTPLSL